MAIQMSDNFDLKSSKYLDSRQYFKTILDMKNFNPLDVPNGFVTYCEEDGNNYKFNNGNTIDNLTGLWRAVTSGGGDVGDLSNYALKNHTHNIYIPYISMTAPTSGENVWIDTNMSQ